MENRNVRTRRVSGQQLHTLCKHLRAERDIAVAYNRSLQAKENSKRKWQEIAATLNAQGDGAYKDWKSWSKYWIDYKAKLKRKVAALRSSESMTGEGPSMEQPLSEIDKKFLQILGDDFRQGLSGIQVEPFPENNTTVGTDETPSDVDAVPTTKNNNSRRKFEDDLMEMAANRLTEKPDEYQIWAMSCATDLKKMEPMQQIYAKKAIADIMMDGQLGLLHRNSVKMNSPTITITSTQLL